MWLRGPWASTGLLALALALGTGPASAAAQQEPLTVSRDGQHWTTSLDAPLFDGARRWVPGDTETVTVWVRRPWDGPADLAVTVAAGDAWSERDLALTARVDGRPARIGADLGRGVRTDGPTRVDLTATMPRSGGDAGQDRRASFDVAVRVTSSTGGQDVRSSGPTEPSGLSVPVAGRHVTENGALPVGVPLTLAAIALAVRAALRERRHHQKENRPCPQQ